MTIKHHIKLKQTTLQSEPEHFGFQITQYLFKEQKGGKKATEDLEKGKRR